MLCLVEIPRRFARFYKGSGGAVVLGKGGYQESKGGGRAWDVLYKRRI